MIKKCIALYINKNALQLVVLKKSLGQLRLLVTDSIKIPPGTMIGIPIVSAKPSGEINVMQDDLAKNFQETEALKMSSAFQSAVIGLLKKHNIKQGEVVATALPPEFIVIRYFQMPRLAPSEHKTAIPFEALKYLPYKLEDIVYAYTISYEKTAANKMAVTFVAAEKKSVASYINFIHNVGLRVGYLEAIPYSLIRLLYHAKYAEPGQSIVFVHLGGESANINIVRNRILYLTRNVSFGNKGMSSLQTTLKAIDEEQFAYEAKFENLLTETRLSFDYFHRQFPEEKIEKMVIWSDDDKAHGFAQRASKELNVFAKISNPLEDLKVGKGYAVEYAIGYGLALRSLYEFKEDINLSPGFKKIEVEQLLRLAVFEMCLAAAILFMFYTFDTGKVQVLQNEFNQTIKHRSNIDVNIENVSSAQLQKTKQQIQGKLNYLQNLIEGRILLSSKLDRASQLLPKDLWLDKLTYGASKDNTKHVLTLVGYANKAKGDDQIKAINNFLETLKTDSQFSSGIASIKLESISNAKYSDTVEVSSFIISCSME